MRYPTDIEMVVPHHKSYEGSPASAACAHTDWTVVSQPAVSQPASHNPPSAPHPIYPWPVLPCVSTLGLEHMLGTLTFRSPAARAACQTLTSFDVSAELVQLGTCTSAESDVPPTEEFVYISNASEERALTRSSPSPTMARVEGVLARTEPCEDSEIVAITSSQGGMRYGPVS